MLHSGRSCPVRCQWFWELQFHNCEEIFIVSDSFDYVCVANWSLCVFDTKWRLRFCRRSAPCFVGRGNSKGGRDGGTMLSWHAQQNWMQSYSNSWPRFPSVSFSCCTLPRWVCGLSGECCGWQSRYSYCFFCFSYHPLFANHVEWHEYWNEEKGGVRVTGQTAERPLQCFSE